MAIAKVQQKEALTAANATSQAITLDNPPATDNILWLGIGGDKNTGSIATWATANNWNVVMDSASTSVSMYLLWKVSDGTEQTITPAWGAASLSGSTVWYSEWSDSAVAGGNWLVPTSATNPTSEAIATTWPTGTTGTVSGSGAKALAVAAMDSGQSITTSRDAWGNSFVAEFDPSVLTGRAGLWVASLDAPAGSTYSSSFNFTGTADQISAAIAVFRKAATGAPTLNENVSHPANSLFRLRFEVQETGGVAVASAFQLRFSKNGGAYTQVTTATDVRPAASAQFADGAATTDLLPSGTGTFVAGVGEEADAVTPSISLSASGHTELEYALTIFTGTAGDTFAFRVYKNDGTALDSYAVTPQITVASAGGTTYTKTGVLIADTLAAGADVFEAVEAGKVIAGTQAGAADVFQAAETGSLIADTVCSGADVYESSETGALVAGTLQAGASQRIGGGSAGKLVAGTLASGADVFAATESGALIASARVSAADTFEAAETGSLISGTLLRGAGQSGFVSKLGKLLAGTLTSAADAFTGSRTGALVTRAVSAAADVFQATETGSLRAGSRVEGTSQKVSPVVYEKTGMLTAGTGMRGVSMFESAIPTGHVEGGTATAFGVDASSATSSSVEGATAMTGAVE